MENIDKNIYLEITLKHYLKENPDALRWKIFQKNNNIPIDERKKMIKQFFITNGFCPDFLEDDLDIYDKILRQEIYK